MYKEETMRRYAQLVARIGANVQSGQLVQITCSVENADFGRLIAEECYKIGAADVIMRYFDDATLKLRYQYCSEETLSYIPEWQTRGPEEIAEKGGCFIYITDEDPYGMAGLDMAKIGVHHKASMKARERYYKLIDRNVNQWTVVAAATRDWASRIYPDMPVEAACEKLWDDIFHCVRLDEEDPIDAWEEHTANLRKHCEWLNRSLIRTLHFTNSLGTDLRVEMVENYIWQGGADFTLGGVAYQANMPTEEVFTAPHLGRVNGIVYSAMPLNHDGSLVDKFFLRFEDGKVIEYGAEVGEDVLKTILETDEGAKRLGEVALVPFKSLIRDTGILFLNTLFDENAACHLALGSSYPNTIRGGVEMSDEERLALGCNDSLTHVDFMFGTADMSIVGYRDDGTSVQVFENGDWAF